VHSPRGIQAVSDGAAWTYPLTDALGSVRGYADASNNVLSSVNYTPIGVPDTDWNGWAFTGEWRSENETQYHRARHLSPGLGVWLSLDPFEGLVDRPMSLNGYMYVEGRVSNSTDPSGMMPDPSTRYIYSCNCGWLDLGHVHGQGAGWGRYYNRALSDAAWMSVMNVAPYSPGRILNHATLSYVTLNAWYYIPENIISNTQSRNNVALGIWMDMHMDYESTQPLGRFASEDLPSNLVGYYLSLQHDNAVAFAGEEAALRFLRDEDGGGDNFCGVMTREDSDLLYAYQSAFYTVYAYDTPDFWRENRNWEPELGTLNFVRRYGSNAFPDGNVPCRSDSWPARLRTLTASAVMKKGYLPVERLAFPIGLPTDGWYKISGLQSPGLSWWTGVVTAGEINNRLRSSQGVAPLVFAEQPPPPNPVMVYGLNTVC
jgi:RHS repeat-associated protein